MVHGERFNGITHGVGAMASILGGVLLVGVAMRSGDAWRVVSVGIYSLTLLLLYLTSTLYHRTRGATKDVLRKMDHCAIYLLIAGTYTPFTLVTLRATIGWTMFGVVWTLAVLGIAQELLYARRGRVLSLVIYVVMGWLAVVGIGPLIDALGRTGFAWLAAGGVSYTAGIVFYATDQGAPWPWDLAFVRPGRQ